MKKIVSFLLIVTLLLSVTPVWAQDLPNFHIISFDAGTGVIKDKAIVTENDILVTLHTLSRITHYSYLSEDNGCFTLATDENYKTSLYWIFINMNERCLMTRNMYIDLDDVQEVNGDFYLSLSQMLPIFGAEIFNIRDGVIYIATPPLLFSELFHDQSIHSLTFDYYSAADKVTSINPTFAAVTLYGLDSFDKILERISVIGGNDIPQGDYVKIFADIIADNKLYLQAMTDGQSDATLLELTNSGRKLGKKFTSFDRWLGKSLDILDQADINGKFVEFLENMADSDDIAAEINEVYEIYGQDYAGFSLFDIFDSVTYMLKSRSICDDNAEMFQVIYGMGQYTPLSPDSEYLAAEQVYDTLVLQSKEAILNDIKQKINSILLDKVIPSPGEIFLDTMKLLTDIMETLFTFDLSEAALLPHYSALANKACDWDWQSEESLTNSRLAAIFKLLISRKGYQIMLETYGDSPDGYLSERISTIESTTRALYLLAENVRLESAEHFDEYYQANRQKLAEAGLLTALPKIGEAVPPSNSSDNMPVSQGLLVGQWMYKELTVTVRGDSADMVYFDMTAGETVFTRNHPAYKTKDDTYGQIYSFRSNAAFGGDQYLAGYLRYDADTDSLLCKLDPERTPGLVILLFALAGYNVIDEPLSFSRADTVMLGTYTNPNQPDQLELLEFTSESIRFHLTVNGLTYRNLTAYTNESGKVVFDSFHAADEGDNHKQWINGTLTIISTSEIQMETIAFADDRLDVATKRIFRK